MVKIFQLELYQLYNDPYDKFDDLALEKIIHKKLPMNWCLDLNGEEVAYFVVESFGFNSYVN